MLKENGVRVKRAYGKIDEKILIEGIASGLNYAEAGKIAGSKGKDDKTITESVSVKISNDTNIKKDIVARLQAHRDKILDALEKKDMDKEPSGTLNLILCQTLDKIQLLTGQETERIGIKPIVIRESEPNVAIMGPNVQLSGVPSVSEGQKSIDVEGDVQIQKPPGGGGEI